MPTIKILSGLSRYWQRDPDIPIFRSKIPNFCGLSASVPSIIKRDVDYIIHGHVLFQLSKFQFRQAKNKNTMAVPHLKKPKVASKYCAEWEYYHMRPSKKGVTFALCKICSVDAAICTFLIKFSINSLPY